MISIVIPTRSRSANLRNTIKAVINQTEEKEGYELIISDDNSTDDTQSVINEFKDQIRFRYVFNNYKPHSWNASVPRNLGALIANPDTKGYYFIDSDVIVPPDAVRNLTEDNMLYPDSVLIGPYHWHTKGHDGILQTDVRWPQFESTSRDDVFTRVTDGLACFGGNIFIPRDIFWSVNGFSVDTHIGLEDGDMGLKLWKRQTKFRYDKRLLGQHQWHETPSDRFPSDMKQHIDKLNIKHFHTTDPDYGIVEASREAYENWGITGWTPPQEWLENKLDMGLKINKNA